MKFPITSALFLIGALGSVSNVSARISGHAADSVIEDPDNKVGLMMLRGFSDDSSPHLK
jgi:hypothetical protein